MQNLMSMREYTRPVPALYLQAVWYVDADHTYCVRKRNVPDTFFVAVRTLTGVGHIELQDGTVHDLNAGSLLLLDQRMILHYAADSCGWQFYWFEFACEDFAPKALNQTIELPVAAQEHLLLERCFRSLNLEHRWECTLAESSFSCLLADWLLRAERRRLPAPELLEALEKGRRERLSIAALAKQAGMCERSFRDTVRKATGVSPKTYMLRGEMTAAMELVKTTTMTLSEIAGLFQYKDPFYFSRVFKKYHGISPQQVRQENK